MTPPEDRLNIKMASYSLTSIEIPIVKTSQSQEGIPGKMELMLNQAPGNNELHSKLFNTLPGPSEIWM